MSRRPPKTYPPGTFLPHPQRLFAIAQLCISFSLILWMLGQPFLGEYYALRSRMVYYEYTMGTSESLMMKGEGLKMERNREQFSRLPQDDQALVINDYKALQEFSQRPFLTKILDGFKVLFLQIPAFEMAWLFLSVVLSLLLLLKVEGAPQAVWILPLLVLAYAIDNRLEGLPQRSSPDQALFPSEQTIFQEYTKTPLGHAAMDERVQLQTGWEEYLIDLWLPKGFPAANRTEAVELAEYQFNLARLKLLHNQPQKEWLSSHRERVSLMTLITYMVWNLLFAWTMNKKKTFQPA